MIRKMSLPYLLFHADEPDVIMTARFVELYGREPEEIIHTRGGNLVGPLPEEVRGFPKTRATDASDSPATDARSKSEVRAGQTVMERPPRDGIYQTRLPMLGLRRSQT